MKLSIIIILVIILAGGGYLWYTTTQQKPPSENGPIIRMHLTPEIEEVLDKKIVLMEELAQNQVVVSEVAAAYAKNKEISQSEIDRLDAQWQKAPEGDPVTESFLTNTTAQQLTAFQKNNPGFAEIFVADAKGLNVGQTNKTSDYYQADEEWWVQAYNNGQGKKFHGEIEFDESSQTEAIALYVPVIEPQSQQAIGVMKAVFDLSRLKSEL